MWMYDLYICTYMYRFPCQLQCVPVHNKTSASHEQQMKCLAGDNLQRWKFGVGLVLRLLGWKAGSELGVVLQGGGWSLGSDISPSYSVSTCCGYAAEVKLLTSSLGCKRRWVLLDWIPCSWSRRPDSCRPWSAAESATSQSWIVVSVLLLKWMQSGYSHTVLFFSSVAWSPTSLPLLPTKWGECLDRFVGLRSKDALHWILVFVLQGLPVAFACFLTRCLTREPWALPLAGSTAKYKQRREHLESDIMFTKQNRQVLTVVCEKVLRLSIPWSWLGSILLSLVMTGLLEQLGSSY